MVLVLVVIADVVLVVVVVVMVGMLMINMRELDITATDLGTNVIQDILIRFDCDGRHGYSNFGDFGHGDKI